MADTNDSMQDRPKRAQTKLFIADVDGCMVTKDKVLTARAQKAVHDMVDKGILFAVTSGRPPEGMKMLIEPLHLKLPIAAFNGGMFVEPNSEMHTIEEHTIPNELPEQIIKTILDHKLDAWVYRGKDWFVRDENAPHVAREAWTVKFAPKVVADFSDVSTDVAKIVGISDDLDAVARCETDLRSQFGDKVSAARSQPYYVDVTHPNANKGGVAEWLSKKYGIPAENIATIGDQPNDVLMFRKSGLSIAMGNASDDVKHQATETTDSYEDEGFAKAVERFILTQ